MLVRRSFAAIFLAVMTSAAQAETPPVGSVILRSVSYAGRACPGGTVSARLLEDGQAIGLVFDRYELRDSISLPATDRRTNCQLAIELQVPDGWSYAMKTLDLKGYARLASGATARFQAMHYYSGQSATWRAVHQLKGPVDRVFAATVPDFNGPVGPILWSPCGFKRAINLNTSAQVASLTAASRDAVYALADGDPFVLAGALPVEQRLNLYWRRCASR